MRVTLDIDADEIVISSKKGGQTGMVETGQRSTPQAVSEDVQNAGAAPNGQPSQTGPLQMIANTIPSQQAAVLASTVDGVNAGAAPNMEASAPLGTYKKSAGADPLPLANVGIPVVDAGPAAVPH